MKRAWGGWWLVVLGASACERIQVPAEDGQTTQQPALTAPGGGVPGFLRANPQLTVAHAGLRRLEFHPVGGPGLAYRERVITDGQGRFSIVPVDGLQSSTLDWDSFELLQRSSEGFLFRYRDFAVRDARRFQQNYEWRRLGQTIAVAGRDCERFHVERREGPAKSFELAVDVQTGLVLASVEYGEGGAEVARMTYEQFGPTPPPGSVVWHQPANEEQPLAQAHGLSEQLGETVLEPRLLPEGYGLAEAATVGDGAGRRWLKLTYEDGVEPLFFFQELERVESLAVLGTEWDEPAPIDPHPAESRVVVHHVGAATAIQGSVNGFRVITIGKVGEAELLDLIESALP